jgi:hypothetical protein
MKQVLRRWEHLLNTPSASITDELDPKKGSEIASWPVKSKDLPPKIDPPRSSHPD